MGTLFQDIRYGLRMLAKNPGFTVVAVLTLALGIGANTAIFSIVNSVLLRPLAYRQPEHLFVVREVIPQLTHFYPSWQANAWHFATWQRDAKSFSDMAAIMPLKQNLTGLGEPEEIFVARATANFFSMLGVEPRVGRSFLPAEDEPGHDQVAILSQEFWQRRFSADPNVLGKRVTLEGVPRTIVGVLPASFHFPKKDQLGPLTQFGPRIDVFVPMAFTQQEYNSVMEFDYTVIARTKPGIAPKQALAELNVLQAQIDQKQLVKQGVDLKAELWPMEDTLVGPARQALVMLQGAVSALLLIVCVNLANLLLSRGWGRNHEVAIRSALGATPARLMKQMLTETILLAIIGGAFGLVLAAWGLGILVNSAPVNIPRLDEVHLEGRVLAFALSLAISTGIFFGILAAWRLVYADPQQALKSGGPAPSGERRGGKIRDWLVALEVGLSVALLIVASLLTESLFRLLHVNAGFNVERILTADLILPYYQFKEPEQRIRFFIEAVAKLQALPGVSQAGLVSLLPLEGESFVDNISIQGEPDRPDKQPLANFRFVSPGYLESMGIPLKRGRLFEEGDRRKHAAIISEQVAQRVLPGEDPIGKKLQWQGDWNEIVGVVGDIRAIGLDHAPVLMAYVPFWENKYMNAASLSVRTQVNPDAMAGAIRAAIRNIGEQAPVPEIRTMKEIVGDSVGPRRFQTLLALLFAGCALVLASLGIYGVLAYSVAQRRKELAIRSALGAGAMNLYSLVLRQGLRPAALGLAAGVGGGLAAGRLISGLLFGIKPDDPLAIGVVIALTASVASAACLIPARRATKVDPMAALRYE